MESLSAWRTRLETELKGRSYDSLVTTTDGGVRIEPIVEDATRSLVGRRGQGARAGLVLGPLAPAPAGPRACWWRGAPGEPSATIEVVVVEAEAPSIRLDSRIEVIVVGSEGPANVRLAAPHGIRAAERGAGPVSELALALVELVRALEASRPPPSLAVALTVGPELFVEVAKLRAARRATAGLLRALGQDEGAIPLVVREKSRALAATDTETNALRSTVACAAGLIGGASHVALSAFDAGLSGAGEAARLAWATGEVLLRESRLALFDDAASGAPFIEALTDAIGRDAWALVRDALAGGDALAQRAERDVAARATAIRTRARPLVGVSRFAGARAAHASQGDAAPFEALSALGAHLGAEVVWLGDAKLSARVEFAREALELLGGEVHVGLPSLTVEEAASHTKAELVIIAAPDALFSTDVVELARVLASRGHAVAVAGKPKEAEASLRAAGVRAFVYQGGDIIDALFALTGARR